MSVAGRRALLSVVLVASCAACGDAVEGPQGSPTSSSGASRGSPEDHPPAIVGIDAIEDDDGNGLYEGSLIVADATDGRKLSELGTGPREEIAVGARPRVSPDGKRLAYRSREAFVVRDLETGDEVEHAYPVDEGVGRFWWTPDGSALTYVTYDLTWADDGGSDVETALGTAIASDGELVLGREQPLEEVELADDLLRYREIEPLGYVGDRMLAEEIVSYDVPTDESFRPVDADVVIPGDEWRLVEIDPGSGAVTDPISGPASDPLYDIVDLDPSGMHLLVEVPAVGEAPDGLGRVVLGREPERLETDLAAARWFWPAPTQNLAGAADR